MVEYQNTFEKLFYSPLGMLNNLKSYYILYIGSISNDKYYIKKVFFNPPPGKFLAILLQLLLVLTAKLYLGAIYSLMFYINKLTRPLHEDTM